VTQQLGKATEGSEILAEALSIMERDGAAAVIEYQPNMEISDPNIAAHFKRIYILDQRHFGNTT
jgi:hypothetical protein